MDITNPQEALKRIGDVDPTKLAGIDAVILFDLAGEHSGKWTITLADGKARLEQGETAQPNLTLSMASQDLVSLFNGKLNPMAAVMQGKIKISGDMSLAMQLQNILA